MILPERPMKDILGDLCVEMHCEEQITIPAFEGPAFRHG